MRKLPRPGIAAVSALKACASSIRDSDLKERLRKIENTVDDSEGVYAAYGEVAKLYRIKGTDNIDGLVTGDEMDRVYNNTFVKSVKTRSMYDKIKKACENDICPLCGQRTVFQLDHYLPISEFPVYGVTAINLVPACSDCNKLKLAHAPTAPGEQTLHPYFDDIEQERWLYATVLEFKPAALTFSVVPPPTWDALKTERVSTHFRTFGLGALYATHAAVEINNMRHSLTKLSIGPDSANAISAHLRERAESCAAAHLNSWQTATFDALANSEWFCSGGFKTE